MQPNENIPELGTFYHYIITKNGESEERDRRCLSYYLLVLNIFRSKLNYRYSPLTLLTVYELAGNGRF